VQRRAVQNTADAAALAAAQDLSPALSASCASDPACLATVRTSAVNDAAAYSAKNGGPSTLTQCGAASDANCYTWPYKNDNGRIEVRVKKTASTSLAASVGLGSLHDASARAVGSAHAITSPAGPLALFAYTHNGADLCGSPYGITVNGNPQTSIAAVLSNGSVTVNASGSVVYAGYSPPSRNCTKAGMLQGNAATWDHRGAVRDWPRTFNRSAICTGHDSNVQRNLDSPADGIYCSNVGIKLTGLGSGKIYHLTIVAPVINIPSNINHFTLFPDNADLDASNQDLALWQYGPGQDFTFDHNNSDVNGVIWIENGNLAYTGNSGTTGFYEAQNISIDGNSYVMHGSGPSGPDVIVDSKIGLAE